MIERPVRTLAVFPYYADNPWQDTVHQGLVDRGDRVVGLADVSDVGSVRAQLGGLLPDSLHLGWSTPVTQTVPDVVESMRRVRVFLETVRELRRLGVRVVWTVHNVLSHELHHVVPEIALHQGLADEVDVVHVMNPRTAEVVRPLYSLPPASTRVLPHPSYPGVDVGGVADESPSSGRTPVRLLLIGEIRPYKGIVPFAQLVHAARSEGVDVTLEIRGRVGGGLAVSDLVSELSDLDGVSFVPGRVAEADLAPVLSGADALVVPYAAGLNSGVAVLAASAGRPLLVGPALRGSWSLEPTWQLPLWPARAGDETADHHGHEVSPRSGVAALRGAVARVGDEGPALRRAAREAARLTAPETLAHEYAELFLPTV